MSRYSKTGALALAFAAAATGAAQAETMRIAHGFPARSIVDDTLKVLAQHVEDNADLDTGVFALTVLDVKQASPGLTSGVADAAEREQEVHPAGRFLG